MLPVNGFFGHIQHNHLRSMVMFFGFAIACQLIGAAILVGPLLMLDRDYEPVSNLANYLQSYGVAVFVFSAVLFLVRFFLHVRSIQQSVRFQLVNRIQEPRICKIVELQAIGAGISMPGVGVINDDARNAFACGMSEHSAVVVVTSGLLLALDDDELEAVVAHEITHIVNGDIQLMAAANVMLSSLFLLEKYNPVRLISNQLIFLYILLPPLLLLFLLTGFITSLGMTLGKLSRLLIASSREFIADAEAVRMTKNPAALISALKRIEGRSEIEGLDEAIDAMMIDGAVEGAYASHPTIAERIAVLSQHAGAMVHGAGTRKDTRNYDGIGDSQNGAFGVRLDVAKTAAKTAAKTIRKAPDRLLINRVNAGSNENAFGLTKKQRIYVLLAVAAPFLLPVLLQFPSGLIQRTMEDNPRGISSDVPQPRRRSTGVSSALPAKFNHVSNKSTAEARANEDLSWIEHTKTATKLAAQNPLKSRCFGHEDYRYHVGFGGRKKFRKPNQKRVNAFQKGRIINGPSIDMDRYVADRLMSYRKISSAVDLQSLDKALISYLSERENLLAVMHRFYGIKGLRWMLNAYESRRDQKVVKRMNERFLAGNAANINREIYEGNPRKSQEFIQKVALLVDNSKHFIPCYARAVLGPPRQSSAAKAVSIQNTAPTIPVTNTALRGSN